MPNDLSQPIAIVDAKAAKQELEAAVLALVQAYESQYGCLVAGFSLADKRATPESPRRTYAVTSTVYL
jgi:hypothetical protein